MDLYTNLAPSDKGNMRFLGAEDGVGGAVMERGGAGRRRREGERSLPGCHRHGNKSSTLAIVSRTAEFIINSARAAARVRRSASDERAELQRQQVTEQVKHLYSTHLAAVKN